MKLKWTHFEEEPEDNCPEFWNCKLRPMESLLLEIVVTPHGYKLHLSDEQRKQPIITRAAPINASIEDAQTLCIEFAAEYLSSVASSLQQEVKRRRAGKR